MAAIRNVRRLALGLPAQPTPLGFRRSMASAPPTYDFLIVVPDKPDARARRLDVRSRHFEELQSDVEAGRFKMGGALLESVPKDDQVSSLDFWGSTLVMNATSKHEVLERLRKDAYCQNNVWDMEKVQIYPFKPGFKSRS